MPCIIFAANRAFSLTSSRLPLMQRFLEKGWQVVAVVSPDDYTHILSEMKVIVEPVGFYRSSVTTGGQLLFKLIQIYRHYQPEIIHQFHTKPMFLGTIASYFVPQAKVINTITGLGFAFVTEGITNYLTVKGYQMLGRKSDIIIYQNHDDYRLFLDKKWVNPEKARLIVSSGVDIHKFSPAESPSLNLRVLMVTRLLWQKGVKEYIEAAERLKCDYPQVRFHLAGEWETKHPNGVPSAYIEAAVAKGVIEFLGYLKDMPLQLQGTDIFVLPSYYREGVPRVLLEAAASGVPVVTTDFPGCREAVIANETGYLVPPQDSKALSEAIALLLSDAQLRENMGQAGRRYILDNLTDDQIIEAYFRVYQDLCHENIT
ncbi:glycosyltransferase family 4 protein [Gloeocapsa sp. PCC 73106]|uniref:glycosyltransferase family 4 protein n=1 Tax=Gloeocapsa sp. PCC 73106 TaxID=102232 RepID=UPI0002AD1460|nr:glycosyltransferase family 4 protein [Gloeocapsa sp. PCC 73106]ELR99055.1 glycosyltransferase [Gloeocapsa sp. PCC 73106]